MTEPRDMSDPEGLIAAAQAFLRALDASNTRAWWLAHKDRYEAALKAPAERLLAELAPRLAALSGEAVGTKLFRPQRDVRFSADKTPYHTHLHMMWPLQTGARQAPVFFFGIGRDDVTVGAGIMGLQTDVLADWRKFADLDRDRVLGIVAEIAAAGAVLWAPELKRVPPPHGPDHPAERLLRMKSVVATLGIAAEGPLVSRLEAGSAALWPLNALLLQVAEA